MYSEKNYQTKKALLEDFRQGIEIRVYQPNQMFSVSGNGDICIEGPHYPQAHKWYASAKIENFIVKSVK